MTETDRIIFLSAGEASGDHYGAGIIAELLARHPATAFFGLGGLEMEAAGMERVIRAEDVAHMGITEVVRHAPRVYGSYRRLVASIRGRRPHAAVLIDFPDVNLRLARELKKLGVPVVYFVSPQLWAWKRRRLRWVQQRVDRMMVIFPFEESFYRARGVDAKFTGHPLAELPLPSSTRQEYAQRSGLDSAKQWVALLPGSRWKEVQANLPRLLKVADTLGNQYDYLLPLASTIAPNRVEELLVREAKGITATLRVVTDAREALFHARASAVASGTATVQAALIGNPFVVVYSVSPMTFRIAKRLVRYSHEVWPDGTSDAHGNLPIAMVNLIAGRRIVPELIQENFTAENVSAALTLLINNAAKRKAMIADLAQVRHRLLAPTGRGPIIEVADAVEQLIGRNPKVQGSVGQITQTNV